VIAQIVLCFGIGMDTSPLLPAAIQLAVAEAKGLSVKRKPGRPRKVTHAPSYEELECARI